MGSSSEAEPRFDVVVTRDEERARPVATRLAAHGLHVVALPLTRTEPATPQQWAAMVAQGQNADRYDWVVAPSANAAEALVRAVTEGGGRLRGRVMAIGPATAAALAAHRIDAVTPARADAVGAADALLAVGAKSVWWPHADIGREDGIDRLRAGGVEVAAPVAYRTVSAGRDDPALAAGLAALPGAGVVCFYAPSHVAAFAGVADLAVLAAKKVVAIGETTAAALAARGVRVDAVPSTPEPDAMASAIVAVYPGRT